MDGPAHHITGRRRPILSVEVAVESLRAGDYVDFGPGAVKPRIWKVGTTRLEGAYTVVVWLPALPGYERRWTGRYEPAQHMLRVPRIVMEALRQGFASKVD